MLNSYSDANKKQENPLTILVMHEHQLLWNFEFGLLQYMSLAINGDVIIGRGFLCTCQVDGGMSNNTNETSFIYQVSHGTFRQLLLQEN